VTVKRLLDSVFPNFHGIQWKNPPFSNRMEAIASETNILRIRKWKRKTFFPIQCDLGKPEMNHTMCKKNKSFLIRWRGDHQLLNIYVSPEVFSQLECLKSETGKKFQGSKFEKKPEGLFSHQVLYFLSKWNRLFQY